MASVEAAQVRRRTSSAERAFRLARQSFIAGERIDMQDLATELGVDRTTLFRWVSNRAQLLTDILTSLASATFRGISAAIDEVGAARIVRAAELYTETLISSEYYRAFLHRDPDPALRLISTKASPLQRQIVTFFEQMLNEEELAGRFEHSLPWQLIPEEVARGGPFAVGKRIRSSRHRSHLLQPEPGDDEVAECLKIVVRIRRRRISGVEKVSGER